MKHRISTTTLAFCVLVGVLPLAGCSSDEIPASESGTTRPAATNSASAPDKSQAAITATPVPPGPGFGTSTISWNTGDGTIGQVYVFDGHSPEKLFAGNGTSQGSMDAPWIGAGTIYEFRLYGGTERKSLLASVKVERAEK